ncbi:MAG: Coq4 family protein [Pseudomonadales bacterium]
MTSPLSITDEKLMHNDESTATKQRKLLAPTSSPMQWRVAFAAFQALSKDNDDTIQVFKIVDALRGKSDARNTKRMKQSVVGRRILEQRLSLIEVLSDRDRLRTLPEDSLGRVYLDFMEREGLSADGLAAAANEGRQGEFTDPDTITYANWARDSHDLWHVLTSYGRDPLGELGLLGVLYSQGRNPGTAFIALMSIPKTRKSYPGAPAIRTVLQGFLIGLKARWLFAQDWAALLERPINEVRTELRINQPSYYKRSLPFFDPSLSNSDAAIAKLANGV